jgi:hypothetical protein
VRASRVISVVAVALLIALVAGAITLVASAPGATAIVPSHLVVSDGPPTTATGIFTYTTSTGISVTADAAFDFATGAAEVTATASLSIVTSTVEARLVDRTLYLNVAQFASVVGAPWVSAGAMRGPVRLEALAEALRHPDLSRLHPMRARVVRSPVTDATTTTMSFGVVHLPSTAGLPITLPTVAKLSAAVTTGSQGQLLDATVHLANPGDDVRLDFEVTGYDVPVAIAAPAPSDVVPLTSTRAQAIFGTNADSIERVLRALRHVIG